MVSMVISDSYNKKMVNFGKLLRILRKRAKLSQVELSDLIGYKSTGTISLIERGERDMSKQMMAKAANALGVNERIFSIADDDFNEEALDMYFKIAELGKGDPLYELIKSQLNNNG